MYACICNALTEKQVKIAAQQTGSCPKAAYKALGCTPRCGRCVPHVRTMLQNEESARAMSLAAD